MRARTVATLTVIATLSFGSVVLGRPSHDTSMAPLEVPPHLHLELDRSSPEADETVEAVERISLWFTQAPQMAGTSVRLVPEGGEPLDLGDAKASDSDDSLIELAVPETLAAGDYRVYWRAMARDGHTVRGDFAFKVRAGR